MKILALLMLFSLPFFSCSAQKILKKVVEKEWVHYHEGDIAPNQKMYKTADFDFPPSRGRDRFQIFADGTVLFTPIGANDAPVQRKGIWTMRREKNKILITLEKTGWYNVSTYIFEFIKCDKQTLLISSIQMD
jgi:hypothetical protein